MHMLGHLLLILGLTAISLFGGAAWALAVIFRTRGVMRLGTGLSIYAALTALAVFLAPMAGRQVIGCWGQGDVETASPLYCLLNRSYVTPDLADVLNDLAAHMKASHPDLPVYTLDGGFPFTSLPLLPHLSHDDGEKMDLALFYLDETGSTHRLRSPIGYFSFEEGPTPCPDVALTLRWDLAALQGLFRDLPLDEARLHRAISALSRDGRVGKIFLEPHLVSRLGVAHPKVRFQGCRAARHDDHIHIQL